MIIPKNSKGPFEGSFVFSQIVQKRMLLNFFTSCYTGCFYEYSLLNDLGISYRSRDTGQGRGVHNFARQILFSEPAPAREINLAPYEKMPPWSKTPGHPPFSLLAR